MTDKSKPVFDTARAVLSMAAPRDDHLVQLSCLPLGNMIPQIDVLPVPIKLNLGPARFGEELRAWDQGIGLDVILSSCFEPFFGSAPGGAILSSRPARWCGCRAQRRSRTVPSWGRPEGLSLTGASTAAGCCASGSTAVA